MTQHVPKTTSARRGAAAPQNQILVSRTTASAAMESADSSVTNVCILKLVQQSVVKCLMHGQEEN